eukprot:Plantae.Rhodophyta-Hildenbrandia_rubra.ctg19560.p1 GENE.Plantae.Rhodophyta-Hildenbrandia_rubra.ctg19560~~Plantae.Rhodophyta-Hildenbrandia_rubra.ctg19560.p1  ORF type:complete len:408 (+),score=40.52 Plantae.Rhodophyta-Hildenbrandia_rubra.ctg19560:574-1797(+)
MRDALDPENFEQEELQHKENPDQEPPAAHLTEVLKNPDDERFTDAKKTELSGIISKGGFKMVKKQDLPEDAVTLRGRFALTIKDPNTPGQCYKARYVIMGHVDPDKETMVNEAPTALRHSVRLMTALTTSCKFSMWARDVKQAYLQSMSDLLRNAHIYPPKSMSMPNNEMIKVVKPHYGMTEAGACWWKTSLDYRIKDLGMQQSVLDPCLFFKMENGALKGMEATLVDDTLGSGDPDFSKLEEEKSKRFEVKDRDCSSKMRFGGCDIERIEEENACMLSQQRHLERSLTLPRKDQTSFAMLRKFRGKPQWASTAARPDVCFASAQLAQVTEEIFSQEDFKLLSAAIKHMLKQSSYLKCLLLDLDSACAYAFSDASFPGNRDLSSQLGMITLLCDARNVICVVRLVDC